MRREKKFHRHNHKLIFLGTLSHKMKKKMYLVLSIDIIQFFFIIFFFYGFVCAPKYIYLGLCPSKYISTSTFDGRSVITKV